MADVVAMAGHEQVGPAVPVEIDRQRLESRVGVQLERVFQVEAVPQVPENLDRHDPRQVGRVGGNDQVQQTVVVEIGNGYLTGRKPALVVLGVVPAIAVGTAVEDRQGIRSAVIVPGV